MSGNKSEKLEMQGVICKVQVEEMCSLLKTSHRFNSLVSFLLMSVLKNRTEEGI